MAIDASAFNALSPVGDINAIVNLVNTNGAFDPTKSSKIRPELFYTKQLLETIRLGADQYPYYRLAETSPIPDKSRKLQLRRWTPLQAHTIPLVEGIPPVSDKGSVETYELETFAYGRFMEFTDRVDLDMVDPIIATYTKEYSIVAVETLDMLARDALLSVAQKFYANQRANIAGLTLEDKPSIADLRLIVLSLKKALVRPRLNGKFQVICSPEFVYDMITDPYVERFMRYNNSTKTMYENGTLVPMFDMEFYESMATPNHGEWVDSDSKRCVQLFRYNTDSEKYEYRTLIEDYVISGSGASTVTALGAEFNGWVSDSRTGEEASYIPNQRVWNIDLFNEKTVPSGDPIYDASDASQKFNTNGDWKELKIHHCVVVGKDALIRTGLSGEDNAKVYVKSKGSAGVLDPIDQRQSIGFKINSVGFGSARNEAIVDYLCVPSTLNLS